jgi:hypothetical protein
MKPRRKKSQVPEWATWIPVPSHLPAQFHSESGISGFLTWAKSKPYMATGEAELHPRGQLDEIALAYGLALREMEVVANLDSDTEIPHYMDDSPLQDIPSDQLLICCSNMTKQIQSVHGQTQKRKRKQK